MNIRRFFSEGWAAFRAPWGRALGVIFLLTAGVVWLSWSASRLDAESHLRFVASVREYAETEARIDSEVLALHHGLAYNYDALNRFVAKQQALLQAFAHPPAYAADDAELRRILGELGAAVNERNRRLEDFKRLHAALRQAVQFFPAEIHELLDMPEITRQAPLAAQLSRFALYVLHFHDQLGEKERAEVWELFDALAATRLPDEAQPRLEAALRHAALLMRQQPDLERLTRSVLATRHHDLFTAFTRQLEAAWASAEIAGYRDRTLLAVLALLTVVALAWFFLRLEQARQRLAAAREELEQRLAAQLAAEEKLRLHALVFTHAQEGITITDANRRILAVNPAFTRITGYSAAEALGQTPRLLQSGRHDAAFYAEMWRAIEQLGAWQGEIWNRNKAGEIYPEALSIVAVRDAATGRTTHYIGIFSDLTRLKTQERLLQHLAFHDALTGLANRSLLTEHLNQAFALSRRSGKSCALMMLDLDGFKSINARFGKETGDRCLEEIAARLTAVLRSGDTAARLGGDEFALLLLDIKDASEATLAVQRFLALIEQPFTALPDETRVTASVGITLYPDDDVDADTLLRHAEQAMIQSKQSGKNRWSLFDSRAESRLLAHYAQLERLRAALERDEFVLYYQPKVDLRSGRVLGAEALLRWQHPEQGLLAPGSFLPDIERSDLIVALGEWVLASALAQLDAWLNAGLNIDVAVNVAARQLLSEDFPSRLAALKQRWPRAFAHLQLEVVESDALGDLTYAARQIERCHALGLSIALDDFGAGYASLTYLKSLPLDLLKIDQNFVRAMLTEPENLPIIEGVTALAQAFDLPILAEGVESAEHACLLLMLDCDWVQGYGIARPMAADDFPAWMRTWQPPEQCASFRALRWRHEHRILLRNEVHLRNFTRRLLAACREDQPLPADLPDFATCPFTQWIRGEGMHRYAASSDFIGLVDAHRRLHALRDSVAALAGAQRGEQGAALASEIEAVQATALAHLRKLYLKLGEHRFGEESARGQPF